MRVTMVDPSDDDSDRRKRLTIRLNDEEEQELKLAARLYGHGGMGTSTWARIVLLREARELRRRRGKP